MFDRLTDEMSTIAQWMGAGQLEALIWIGDHLEEYDEDFCRQYRGFMRMGQALFAPSVEAD
jgi:hypothetical protein